MREKKEKSVYELELHEIIIHDGHIITRVAGGWLYQTRSRFKEESIAMAFVPYNNEFAE